ncbi:hypothetical protein Acr_08g0007790 [Actinidia rufa]|uniref:Uncharacterized protein n=1 Tax=Actinidia rufa TaxID=165716 RepID=A0A7J0F189_9ERIC|nr:hypothetical protein Acr_08g0007790 [Actinidia rufa]
MLVCSVGDRSPHCPNNEKVARGWRLRIHTYLLTQLRRKKEGKPIFHSCMRSLFIGNFNWGDYCNCIHRRSSKLVPSGNGLSSFMVLHSNRDALYTRRFILGAFYSLERRGEEPTLASVIQPASQSTRSSLPLPSMLPFQSGFQIRFPPFSVSAFPAASYAIERRSSGSPSRTGSPREKFGASTAKPIEATTAVAIPQAVDKLRSGI